MSPPRHLQGARDSNAELTGNGPGSQRNDGASARVGAQYATVSVRVLLVDAMLLQVAVAHVPAWSAGMLPVMV